MNNNSQKKYGIALAVILVLGAVWFLFGVFSAKDSSAETEFFTIEQGEGSGDISKSLKDNGLIKSKFIFDSWAVLNNKHNNLLAGTYQLSPAMNTNQILNKLASGEVATETLTIIEGWTLYNIAEWFENKGIFQAEEIFALTGQPAIDYSQATEEASVVPLFLYEQFESIKKKPGNVSLEGYLFPDTYEIERGESVKQIIIKIINNFEKKVMVPLQSEFDEKQIALSEVLTLASILEKEVQTFEDKKIVAGILWNRLMDGWKLQVDATLNYLTGKDSLSLTKEDLEIDSPYNTYKYFGLPFGPICNPGLESIEAVLDYQETDYWYYLTTADGETIFSKTLDEHNANKVKYLKQ